MISVYIKLGHGRQMNSIQHATWSGGMFRRLWQSVVLKSQASCWSLPTEFGVSDEAAYRGQATLPMCPSAPAKPRRNIARRTTLRGTVMPPAPRPVRMPTALGNRDTRHTNGTGGGECLPRPSRPESRHGVEGERCRHPNASHSLQIVILATARCCNTIQERLLSPHEHNLDGRPGRAADICRRDG